MTTRLTAPVVVTGVGCTPFGNLRTRPEIAGLTLQELAARAAREALEDSGIRGPDVDAVYVGNVMTHSSQLPATYSQLSKWIGTQLAMGVHIDAACATTATGVCLAAQAIASGTIDTALVVGVEATGNRPLGTSPYEREDIDNETMWLWTDYCVNQAYGEPSPSRASCSRSPCCWAASCSGCARCGVRRCRSRWPRGWSPGSAPASSRTS